MPFELCLEQLTYHRLVKIHVQLYLRTIFQHFHNTVNWKTSVFAKRHPYEPYMAQSEVLRIGKPVFGIISLYIYNSHCHLLVNNTSTNLTGFTVSLKQHISIQEFLCSLKRRRKLIILTNTEIPLHVYPLYLCVVYNIGCQQELPRFQVYSVTCTHMQVYTVWACLKNTDDHLSLTNSFSLSGPHSVMLNPDI